MTSKKRTCLMMSDLQSGAEQMEYVLWTEHEAEVASLKRENSILKDAAKYGDKACGEALAERDSARLKLSILERALEIARAENAALTKACQEIAPADIAERMQKLERELGSARALLRELIDIEGPQPGHVMWARKVADFLGVELGAHEETKKP